jgi:hypothetical protein
MFHANKIVHKAEISARANSIYCYINIWLLQQLKVSRRVSLVRLISLFSRWIPRKAMDVGQTQIISGETYAVLKFCSMVYI